MLGGEEGRRKLGEGKEGERKGEEGRGKQENCPSWKNPAGAHDL